MRTGPYIALCAAAIILDATLGPEMEILGARPDIAVLVIVYGALLIGGRTPVIAGFAMGLVADTELPEYLGLNALALSITGYLATRVLDHLVKANVLVQCVVIACAALLHDLIYYVVYYRNHLDLFGRFFMRQSLLGALYTALLGALLYAIAKTWTSRGGSGGSRR